jgi:hypothetical protein
MTKQVTYTYLGTNGVLTTPVHLEGIYSVKKIVLIAEEGKMLTQDNKTFVRKTAVKSEEEIALWKEVIASSGQN